MKQILFALMLTFGVAFPVRAADPVSVSATQMQLASSNVFQLRLTYFMWQQASIVLAEAHSTALHACRYQYAMAVIGAPAQAAANAAGFVVGTNYFDGPILGTVVQWAVGSAFAGQYDTTVGDAGLQAIVGHAWNTLARCDSGV